MAYESTFDPFVSADMVHRVVEGELCDGNVAVVHTDKWGHRRMLFATGVGLATEIGARERHLVIYTADEPYGEVAEGRPDADEGGSDE